MSRPSLAIAATVLSLLVRLTWAAMQEAPAIAVAVPLFGGHEIDVNLWPAPRSLRLVLWHQDIARGRTTRLLACTFPAWLLAPLLGCVMMAVIWFLGG